MPTLKHAFYLLLIAIGCLASGVLYAADPAPLVAGVPDCNTISDTMKYSLDYWTLPGDKSIQYLGIVFGQVGSTLFGEGNDLLGRVFEILNTAIITLATLLLTYSTLVGVMHTAHEGEAMGKKWSSAWIPARSAIGIGLLIPGLSGYSTIQVIIMTIIVQGVGAGNAVWRMVANNAMKGVSITTNSANMSGTNVSATKSIANMYDSETDDLLENLFKGLVCKHIIREAKVDYAGNLPKSPNAAANSPDIPLLNIPDDVDFYIDTTTHTFKIGSQSSSDITLKSICGKATVITDPQAQAAGNDKEADIRLNALSQIAGFLEPAAEEVATSCYKTGNSAITDGTCTSNFTQKGFLLTAKAKYLGLIDAAGKANSLTSDTRSAADQSQDQVFCNALKDGWLFAGSYYYKIVAPPQSKTANAIPVKPDSFELVESSTVSKSIDSMYHSNSTALGCSGDCCTGKCIDFTNRFTSLADLYLTWSSSGVGGKSTGKILKLEPSGSFPKPFNKIWDKTIGSIPKAIVEMLEKQMTQSTFDPLVSMQKMGSDILMIIEITYVAGLILTFVLAIPASMGYGTQPVGMTFRSVLTWILPLAMAMISIMWAGAATLAIYLPLVPYIVFTMAALSWLIVCVEAIVAGPIVALGFMSPSGDHWGKATPAINIMANIFLRPALMIVGFIAGARLFVAAIGMVNFGFSASLNAAVPALGIFGPVAVLVFYAGIVITITHKSFSLIYLIPDKALNWIGGHAEQSGVSQDTQAVGDSANKGIAAGQSAAEGAGKAAGNVLKTAEDKGKAKNEAKEEKSKGGGKPPSGGNV